MTDIELKKVAADALALDRDIAAKNARLKKLKKRLVDEAKARRSEREKTPGGGWSFTVPADSRGSIVRVTKAGRGMRSSFAEDDEDLDEIRELVGDLFSDLFDLVTTFKPVENFRDEALAQFPDSAVDIIKLCTSTGKTSVSFETKELVEDEE